MNLDYGFHDTDACARVVFRGKQEVEMELRRTRVGALAYLPGFVATRGSLGSVAKLFFLSSCTDDNPHRCDVKHRDGRERFGLRIS